METVGKTDIGKLYRVQFDDCCVGGEFTSRLKEVFLEHEGGESKPTLIAIAFENGVHLHNISGVQIDEAH